MTSTIPQQQNYDNNNVHQNQVLPIHEKTQQEPQPSVPQQQQQLDGLITPPMSPVNNNNNNNNSSIASSGPPTARNSLKVNAGQTGLPWLNHDAEDNNLAISQSPETATSNGPPKFSARANTTSLIRIPTRKRTMQKYVYSMKDGIDPVKVLCDRLTTWETSVKYLSSMFQNIKKVESNTGKSYRKIDSKFALPSVIENEFKSTGGVKDAWSAFRQYTRENSLIHQDFVDFIESEIIPTLQTMLKDIHHYMNSLKQNKELHTSTLWDCRKKSDRIITQLNAVICATVESQEKSQSQYVSVKNDPLLTKYMALHTVQALHIQENRLHKKFLETQDQYRQFEQNKIINVYTEMFQNFEEYRNRHQLENLEAIAKVANIFNAIEIDSEWLHFLSHHQNDLVKQTSSFKNEQVFDFPNIAHPLVQPIMISDLQRRHGKKWHKEFYVLSPVGFLHRFKSEKDFYEYPLGPEDSLFVPQCSFLVDSNKHLVELRGKSSTGVFSSKKHFELSSDHPDILNQWIERVAPIALKKETPVNTMRSIPPATSTAAPAALTTVPDNRSVHSKILATDEDHQNAPTTMTASPIEQQQQQRFQQTDAPTQPIQQEGQHTQITPITNANSNVAYEDNSDDGDNYRRETIEYSTHSPTAEYPSTTAQDANNPFVMSGGGEGEKINHDAPTNIANPTTDNNYHHKGLTREGSDLFWDTATTATVNTPNVDRQQYP